jgi:cytochrome bd-type quinol oxidase subunit 2
MATRIVVRSQRVTPHTGHRRHFLRHLLEMTVAMMVGMAAAVPVLWAIFAALGVTAEEATKQYPELICLVVAGGMVGSMVTWMRHRGHNWRLCTEMAAAMVAPLVPIFGLLWAGVVPGESACGVYCVAMLPAMLTAMLLRRSEYSGASAPVPMGA